MKNVNVVTYNAGQKLIKVFEVGSVLNCIASMASSKTQITTSPATASKQRVKVTFIVLEEGEFLYDQNALKIYTCNPPHKCVGTIDPRDLKPKFTTA